MERSLYFFTMFLATLVITRVFLYFKPIASPTIKSFRLHHYMYGIVLVMIGFFIKSVEAYAVGLGLFIDQVPHLIGSASRKRRKKFNGKSFNKDVYWKKEYLLRLAVLVLIVFFLRSHILF